METSATLKEAIKEAAVNVATYGKGNYSSCLSSAQANLIAKLWGVNMTTIEESLGDDEVAAAIAMGYCPTTEISIGKAVELFGMAHGWARSGL